MKDFLRLSLVALLMGTSGQVHASSIICTDRSLDVKSWVEKHLSSADAVLLGKVLSEETPQKDWTDTVPKQPAESMSELVRRIEESYEVDYENRYYQSVSLEVEKQWKGPAFKYVVVKNKVIPGQYGFPLRVGKSYLVFIYAQGESIHTISTVCESTLEAAKADSRIEILDQLSKAEEVDMSSTQ